MLLHTLLKATNNFKLYPSETQFLQKQINFTKQIKQLKITAIQNEKTSMFFQC